MGCRYNRTFMELKYRRKKDGVQRRKCYNRTFMELKFDLATGVQVNVVSYNRTFMELKLNVWAKPTQQGSVIIVPLWN